MLTAGPPGGGLGLEEEKIKREKAPHPAGRLHTQPTLGSSQPVLLRSPTSASVEARAVGAPIAPS